MFTPAVVGYPRPMPTGDLVTDVRKIAVLRANAIGDFIFALPALESLRWAYPDAEIVLLGAPWHGRFLAGRGTPVDRVIVVPAGPGIRGPDPGEAPDSGDFAPRVRGEGFDLALQLHGGGRNSNPVVNGLGARVTAGLWTPDAEPLDRWVRYVYYQPEIFRYLEVVGLVGAQPVTYRPRLPVTPADVAEARAVVGAPARRRVAIHPGASDVRRRWSAARFGAVADALTAQGFELFVTGVPAERDVVEEVRRGTRAPVRPLVGDLSLGGLAAFYRDCSLVISNDTGPLHLANAVGAPTVGLYWIGNVINGAPVDRARHRPMPSFTIHCPRCGEDCTGNRPCDHRVSFVDSIAVEEVVAAAGDLLAESSSDQHSTPRSSGGMVVGASR